MMKITKDFLIEHNACESGIMYFQELDSIGVNTVEGIIDYIHKLEKWCTDERYIFEKYSQLIFLLTKLINQDDAAKFITFLIIKINCQMKQDHPFEFKVLIKLSELINEYCRNNNDLSLACIKLLSNLFIGYSESDFKLCRCLGLIFPFNVKDNTLYNLTELSRLYLKPDNHINYYKEILNELIKLYKKD